VEPYEESTCSFVVRVWVEETGAEFGQRQWRGHVTHIPTGRQQYFADCRTLSSLVASYLQSMGAAVDQGYESILSHSGSMLCRLLSSQSVGSCIVVLIDTG